MSFHIRGSIAHRSVDRQLFTAIVCCWAALAATSAHAVDLVVTSTNDSGVGSLRQAILDANTAGAGNHTITVDSSLNGNSLTLANDLDHIQVNVVINGGGATIDANNQHRIFFIAAGNVTLKNFTLQDGAAQGGNGGSTNLAGGGGGGLGAGGAIFVNSGAAVTVQNVAFANNAAAGGMGGSVDGIGTSTASARRRHRHVGRRRRRRRSRRQRCERRLRRRRRRRRFRGERRCR